MFEYTVFKFAELRFFWNYSIKSKNLKSLMLIKNNLKNVRNFVYWTKKILLQIHLNQSEKCKEEAELIRIEFNLNQ